MKIFIIYRVFMGYEFVKLLKLYEIEFYGKIEKSILWGF